MTKELISLSKYQLVNIARARWLLIYALFFFLFTNALLMFGSNSSKVVASVLNIILLIVPMISILYTTIYWYSTESFTSLLLTQPLRRASIYLSYWLSISLGLAASFALSTGTALFVNHALDNSAIAVLLFGSILSFIFVAIGLLVAVYFTDRLKGVGFAFLLWLYFSVLHDVLVFTVISLLKDYPIEIPSMLLMASNPIDLARVQILLTLDLSALMGYTGKILQHVLSGAMGSILTAITLLLWLVLPVGLGVRVFTYKDL